MGVLSLDARGLSCPEPVMMAKKAMRERDSGAIEMLVDAAARDNVRRAAEMSGWSVSVEEMPGGSFRLVVGK